MALTEIGRLAIDEFLRKPTGSANARGLAAITDLAATKTSDGSVRHDDYVAEAIVAETMKKLSQSDLEKRDPLRHSADIEVRPGGYRPSK